MVRPRFLNRGHSLLAIVGPTAVGKSALALSLANSIGGEILNADSRQVYLGMDVGTAKPSLEERSSLPHHLFDMVTPGDPFNLSLYLEAARSVIAEVHDRGNIPVVVGGTGQYVWALLEGWQTPRVRPDPQLRQKFLEQAAEHGSGVLHSQLEQVDPAAASRIDHRNIRRVVRALEVFTQLGVPFSEAASMHPPDWKSLAIGLKTSTREDLYTRIDARLEVMLRDGHWLTEVDRLLEAGYSPNLPAMSGMGYRELIGLLHHELTMGQVTQRIRLLHRRLARQQQTWFKAIDSRIHWLDIGEEIEGAAQALVRNFLEL